MAVATDIRRNRPLEVFLAPIAPYLEREGVSEISINRPGELFLEENGETHWEAAPELTFDRLITLGELIAQDTDQTISRESPLLSAQLPTGERVQVVFPPACEPDKVVMSIRRQSIDERNLDDYENDGSFEHFETGRGGQSETDRQLHAYLDAGDIRQFTEAAVRGQKNIVVSGGTSTGKTTFLNALMKYVPDYERLITIEDVREVRLQQPNVANLVASRGGQGVAKVTPNDLMKACLRLRPNRIVLGELRGEEAGAYLRAVNSGHPGSITSVHADTPDGAFKQLAFMALEGGSTLTMDQIIEYARSVIDVVIQWRIDPATNRRFVSHIDFPAER